ncbi:transcriptional regulator TetR family [Clostridium aceticum]|uniref:Transcriptional regulator TetR family n=1 Tax=Clostridium aceticum TaxID=84022 RepID=A0A0D8I9I2_9CLOT|nr:TetR/AcrR family transcriptional regulator [Clostridium aceticum]AKL95752.1 transcriptional regulator TetR family [Clostridium aceticum]KJF26702.1 hypothetical protein TZ02_10735 [Clostridium aceticum]
MPKKTFFNLPEEKREMILEVAIDEFASNMYINASITKIAEGSGVAKGSMYQYFHNKKDLYKYILDQIGIKKLSYLNEWIAKHAEMEFIETVRMLYRKGLEFAFAYPKLAKIGNNFINEQDPVIRDEILRDITAKSNQFFIELIEKAKAKGEVHSGVDSEMGAFMIYHFNNALVDSLLSSMAYEEIFIKQETYFKKVDDLLFILKNGFVTSRHKG